MPYQRILDGLVREQPGVQGALLLDAEGELVVDAGAKDYRHRLIGAYQGLALLSAQRTSDRYAIGRIQAICCRYAWGTVILRPLRDGYYLILSLAPDASVPVGMRASEFAQEQMDAALA